MTVLKDETGTMVGFRVPLRGEDPPNGAVDWLHGMPDQMPGFKFGGDSEGLVITHGDTATTLWPGQWFELSRTGKRNTFTVYEDPGSGKPNAQDHLLKAVIWKD